MRDERGFTLIELLIAVVLFGIVAASMYNMLFTQTRFFETEDALGLTQQNSRIALKRIADDVLVAGQGVHGLNMDNPDVIIANDATVSTSTVQTSAITLLTIPPGAQRVGFARTAPAKAQSIYLVNDAAGVALGLKAGDVIMIHNQNDSKLLHVTAAGTYDNGQTVRVDFEPTDKLSRGYPGVHSYMYEVRTLSYRLNATNPARPFLERRVGSGPWEKAVNGIEGLTFTYYNSSGAIIKPDSQTLRRQIRKVAIQVNGRSTAGADNRGTRVRVSMRTEVTPRNLME